MADISKVKNPDGNTYNVKDSTARDHIANKNNPHSVTKAQIGLGNVDNTSDLNKPVSNAVRTALDAKANNSVATESINGLMSAADKKAVNREFFRMLPKGGTYIPANADLNSIEYIKVGNYYNSLDADAGTIKNIPVKSAFMMYVLSPLSEAYDNESTAPWVYRLRIFVGYNGNKIFVQTVSSGTTAGNFSYGPWVKMTNSNDLGAVSKLINDHIANKSNPHAVTKAQIGLGNVDNTSDAEKHVLANNINWGGPVLNDTVSPIDAGISSIHGANRLAFSNPNGITIEYSNDGGSTWSDYGASDREKVELVTSGGHNSSWFYIGKRSTKGTVTINDKLRVTFNAYKCGVYTAGVRLLLNLATDGASGSNVTLETSSHGDATTFSKVGTYPVSGWSGWNSIPINFRFGGLGSDAFRLTFGITGISDNPDPTWDSILHVGAIFLYGTSAWIIPSNMSYNNHLYSFDYAQNAFFPAQVTATKFNGSATSADSATKATQDASGNVITSTYATKNELTSHSQNVSNPHKVTAAQVGALPLSGGTLTGNLTAPSFNGKVNGYTINANVPAGAKFTDTTYSNATASAPGLMSSADKAKLDGIAAGAEKNAITGVKGSSESSYRTGNVNITKANIGLSNVDNTADANKSVKSATSATKDSAGQQINTTYIKELSALGRTITATKGNGSKSIFNIAGDDLYLFYRGVAVGDLNEITTTGIYYVMSGGLANTGPSNIDITYCYLIVIGFAALKQQIILKPDTGIVLMRSYLGQHTDISEDDTLLDENSEAILDEKGDALIGTFKTPPAVAKNSSSVWSRWYKINGIGV